MKKFKPKRGQVDFTRARWAPVMNCVVRYRNKVLLVERSKDMELYPGCLNGIAGFLDDRKSLKEKVEEELREEVGIRPKDIRSIRLGPIFDQEAPKYGKTWVVHPVLVEVKTGKVRLNWEARNYRWVTLKELKRLTFLPGFDKVLRSFLKL